MVLAFAFKFIKVFFYYYVRKKNGFGNKKEYNIRVLILNI